MRTSLVLLALLPLLACEEPAPPAPPPPVEAPPSRDEFQPLSAAYAFGASPLRARWELVEDTSRQLSVGDFYARLRGAFGPPAQTDARGFVYVFRHRPTGQIVTAHVRGAGPWFGGGYRLDEGAPPPKPEDALGLVAQAGREPPGFMDVVGRLNAVLERAPLVDCALVYEAEGTTLRSGARAGQAFDEALPAADALAHALDAYEAAPSGLLFDERGDRALDLWTEQPAARGDPRLRSRVAAYWQGAVKRLAQEPALDDNAQLRALRWSQLWRTRGVNEDAGALARLEKLRPRPWPAALDALKPADDP